MYTDWTNGPDKYSDIILKYHNGTHIACIVAVLHIDANYSR